MSRFPLTSGRAFDSRAFLRFLGAADEALGKEVSTRRAAVRPALVGAAQVRPSPRASFVAIDGAHNAERPDAVAGSEFVDDRIRLQE